MSAGESQPPGLKRTGLLALLVGLAGLGGCLAAGYARPGSFFPAYLVGYLFWVGITLGSISLLLLHNLTKGIWGLLIRRPLEAAALTILPLAVLFGPILLGMHTLYPWTDAEFVEHHETVKHKVSYLNENAFVIRAAIGFAVWSFLAILLNYAGRRRDRIGRNPGWLEGASGPGLALVFFTASFAAIDWVMSLEPDWYSSIYGAMVIVGWGLLTFASMILITALLARVSPVAARVATPGRFQDLGNLMLAFVMLWAYLSFSQFLIIWCGNLAEEIPWYLRRIRGGWQYPAMALIGFGFFAPFFALLFRDSKRNSAILVRVALAVVFMKVVDLAWLVLPAPNDPLSHSPAIPVVSLLMIPLTLVGIGGIWIWAFLFFLGGRPLVMDELVPAETAPDHALAPSPHRNGS